MTFFGKVATGVISAGIVGGGIGASYYALSDYETISQALKKDGFEPLDTSKSSGDWETVFSAYQKATKNTFANGKDTALDQAGLRNKCKDLLNTKPNDKDYTLAVQWCVKEKNASDILEKLGLRELKTEPLSSSAGASNNPDDEKWTNIANIYQNSQSKYKITIKPEDSKPVDKEKMKTACKELKISELKTTSDDFNNKLEQAKEWCTVAKENPAT